MTQKTGHGMLSRWVWAAGCAVFVVGLWVGCREEKAPGSSPLEDSKTSRTSRPDRPERKAWDPALGSAAVKGIVRFQGPPPQPRRIALNRECQQVHPAPMFSEAEIVNPNGTVRNVFVWVTKGLESWEFPLPSENVVVDQKGCRYVPHIVGVRVGQSLEFRNSDPFLHNVNNTSLLNPWKFRNRSHPQGTPPIVEKMSKTQVLSMIKCEVHPWMSVYAGIVDHPFFAVTGGEGTFELGKLPPGEYTIEAAHEKYGKKSVEVPLSREVVKQIEFTFEEQGD